MRLLLDTNILVRAVISPTGAARRIVDQIIARDDHTLLTSAFLLDEVVDVLTRPRIQGRYGLSLDMVKQYRSSLYTFSAEVFHSPLATVITDAKDQPIIEAAVHGRADVIGTADRHFYTSPAKNSSNLAESGF